MQQTISRNFGKDRVCHKAQNQVFSEEIRQFIDESRKCHTLFANFEAGHERVAGSDDLSKLNKFVFLTLSDGKDRASLTPDEFAETEKMTRLIVRKILSYNTKFNHNDVRFQVVWIHYFDYLEKKMKSMPIFKLHKDSKTVYIDITVIAYESWDHFLMFSKFPNSFICVPRRGEYTFRSINGEEMLDLEYICKNSGLFSHRNLRSFSQTLIPRVLNNIVPYGRPVVECLKMAPTFATIAGLQKNPKVCFILLCISGVVIVWNLLEKVLENAESVKYLESTADDCSLMLMNENGEKRAWLNFLKMAFDNIERPQQDKSLVAFIKLMKNPRENILEILKFVPMVFEFCTVLYLTVTDTNVVGSHNAIRLFELLSIWCRQMSEENQVKEKEGGNCLLNLGKYSPEKVVSDLEASHGLNAGKEKPLWDTSGLQEYSLDFFGFRVYLLLKQTRSDCIGFLSRLLKSNYKLQNSTSFQEITRDGKLIGVVVPFSISSEDHSIVAVRLNELPGVNN